MGVKSIERELRLKDRKTMQDVFIYACAQLVFALILLTARILVNPGYLYTGYSFLISGVVLGAVNSLLAVYLLKKHLRMEYMIAICVMNFIFFALAMSNVSYFRFIGLLYSLAIGIAVSVISYKKLTYKGSGTFGFVTTLIVYIAFSLIFLGVATLFTILYPSFGRVTYKLVDGSYQIVSADNVEVIETADTIFGKDVVRVAKDAFKNNDKTLTLKLSEKTKFIAFGALSGCKNIQTLQANFSTVDGYLGYYFGTEKLSEEELAKIEENLGTEYEYYMYQYEKIPESLTTVITVGDVRDNAMYGCQMLKTVAFLNTANIGDNAFGACEGLTSLQFGENTRTIGNAAFSYCTSLTTVYLNYGLTEIDDYAFSQSTSMTVLVLPETVTKCGVYLFYGCDSTLQIASYVNAATISSHVYNDGWSAYWNYVSSSAYCTVTYYSVVVTE
ncbi:MAG: leucine-rich repeat domain-containing protein [Clostridia bacterium]|nr:leucine-rich repeat domain-containing protein [Clostridia bacterium]